jgi:hypothetical protein
MIDNVRAIGPDQADEVPPESLGSLSMVECCVAVSLLDGLVLAPSTPVRCLSLYSPLESTLSICTNLKLLERGRVSSK